MKLEGGVYCGDKLVGRRLPQHPTHLPPQRLSGSYIACLSGEFKRGEAPLVPRFHRGNKGDRVTL